ncbi:CocE/NonD hydrolase [Thozetella sp. PMI_491]|nr:CocE/NonD hydrolase [Thozetella sp. PMI_491]
MATPRGFWRAVGEQLAGWALGLPSESCSYNINPVRIPLRDGVELAADLYRPLLPGSDARPSGQFLVHGPYGRGIGTAVIDASLWAARGYQVLLVSCRGTEGSGGELDPGRNEATDGQDIVVWMRDQPWYPGTFATFGASYLGYTQWALLHDPPADLIACIPTVGFHDYSRNYWHHGAFKMGRISWSDMVAMMDGLGHFSRALRMAQNRKQIRQVMEGLPLLESVRGYFGTKAPWLARALLLPDTTDEWYRPMQHAEALEKANVPILLNTGWYDLFLDQTMEQYARLHERGCDVELTIGPWDHMNAGGIKVLPDIFAWMEEHVAGRAKRDKKFPVRVFVTGAEKWRDLPSWPPATTPRRFYLYPNKELCQDEPTGSRSSSSFTFDPLAPTPTVGGPLLSGGGRVDDGALASRPDVLAFTTTLLADALEIAGAPSVELHHSSDNPHVDVFVRLSAVDSKGRSTNIAEGFRRLQPEEPPGLLHLTMSQCAHRFEKGTRIRLLVAGGTFPLYSRNLGTDENTATAATGRPSQHTISFGEGALSALVLPVE